MEEIGLSQEKVRLAPASVSNICQIVIATVPLLGVLVYLLYEAAIRPNQPIYQVEGDDNVVIEEAWEQTPPLIPIFDMVVVFLVFEGIFMLLYSYTIIFIPRRRRLMESYLQMNESSLGDVTIDDRARCNRIIYGYVEYAIRGGKVRKRVRLYQPYSRERVTVLRLQNYHFSGQPKTDVVIDILAAEAARQKVSQLMWLSLAWIGFTAVFGIPFLLYQMKQLRLMDTYEDVSLAMNLFIFVGVILIPVVSFLGMCLRWAVYRHWVVNCGTFQGDDSEDMSTSNVFVSELVGQTHSGEMSSDERAVMISPEDEAAATPFVACNN
eukprot:CAMPEP_0178896390 /NCGR_PEP_ID=MMETSP0786-20121207/1140_1 /TAXON_ID=186022 /ORGANISM="Thalassionema frauenfeldii, Strain CCMP 1798" /LENGTH=322 /DNA_ID=CAMNT_0020566775 /DNA_START=279 /DNA_END=1245 /DNA_ORIENTATION=+